MVPGKASAPFSIVAQGQLKRAGSRSRMRAASHSTSCVSDGSYWGTREFCLCPCALRAVAARIAAEREGQGMIAARNIGHSTLRIDIAGRKPDDDGYTRA